MERFLIALDCMPDCLKIIDYLGRVLKDTRCCQFNIFHVLPTTSPDKLRRDEVKRIESVHAKRPNLAGYFWKDDDEKRMMRCFEEAVNKLIASGFPKDMVAYSFAVEAGDVPEIILATASRLNCSTIVLGRRRLSRVKEFLLGSVSTAIIKMARGSAIWVIDI